MKKIEKKNELKKTLKKEILEEIDLNKNIYLLNKKKIFEMDKNWKNLENEIKEKEKNQNLINEKIFLQQKEIFIFSEKFCKKENLILEKKINLFIKEINKFVENLKLMMASKIEKNEFLDKFNKLNFVLKKKADVENIQKTLLNGQKYIEDILFDYMKQINLALREKKI